MSFIFSGTIGSYVYLVVHDEVLYCSAIKLLWVGGELTNQLFHELSPSYPRQSCQDGAGHNEVLHSKRQIYSYQLHSNVGKGAL